MAARHPGWVASDVLRLFDGRSVVGLDDGELLGRFVERRDEAAFEALVTRLGPMVLGVCRRMLADPHDVDDAFQATFLVLVRRAGSIDDREIVAPWLHGVAAKVARKARDRSTRRLARQSREEVDPPAPDRLLIAEWSELGAAIDEEIARLPEHHRRAVVLCDVEGLSREEAAARLGWTLNMVRGRLDRARGRLRDRLTRRGLAPSSGALPAIAPMVPKAALIATTVRAGLGVGTVPASALVLAKGVGWMMILSKTKLATLAMLSTGAMVAGAGLIAAQGPGDGPKLPPNPVAVIAPQEPPNKAGDADTITPRSSAELNKARVEVARRRYDQQRSLYENGRDSFDRVIDASKALAAAELDAAGSKADRVLATRANYRRMSEILVIEKARVGFARSTQAAVTEIESGLLDAELLLARELEVPEPAAARSPEVKPGPATKVVADDSPRPRSPAELGKARLASSRSRFESERDYYEEGRTTADRIIAASRGLMEAERDAAESRAARIVATGAHFDRTREVARREQAEFAAGRATAADLAMLKAAALDAESQFAKEVYSPDDGNRQDAEAMIDLERRKREEQARIDAEVAASDQKFVADSRAGKPWKEVWEVHIGHYKKLRADYESSFGTYPKFYQPPSMPENVLVSEPEPTKPAAEKSPLGRAVEAFNQKMKESPDAPLTETEVVAAIRYFLSEGQPEAALPRTRSKEPAISPEVWRSVAETRRLPEGAVFTVGDEYDLGGDYLYQGRFVDLYFTLPDGSVHDFPVRSRLIRAMPLEEEIDRMEAALKQPDANPKGIENRIRDLKRRIEVRDARARKN